MHSFLIFIGLGVLQHCNSKPFTYSFEGSHRSRPLRNRFDHVIDSVAIQKEIVPRILSRRRNSACKLLVDDSGDLVGQRLKHDVVEM